jgi:16S rRNA (adenine1518-N6/adenine1519-N6)-dimethyltransferase
VVAEGDLTNLKTLKTFLLAHNIRPNKRLGQNFLIDKSALQKLIHAAEISEDDTIVEVGAGIGTITVELAQRAKKVIAVEKDGTLIPLLEQAMKDYHNVEIVRGDILKTGFKFPFDKLRVPSGVEGHVSSFKLVGNIPYYLTAPLIRKFLEAQNPPASITLMVQKEMAERICARPPDMSIWAVSVQVYAKSEITSYVPRSSFWPQPRVDSAILKITPFPRDRKFIAAKFFRVVRAGFASPRKQLANTLSKGLGISRADTEQWLRSRGIDPKRRAETLTVEEWKSCVI